MNYRGYLTAMVMLSVTAPIFSQASLDDKYNDLIQSSETYEQYKVITKTTLDAFWKEVMDSTSARKVVNSQLRADLENQQREIAALKQSQEEVQAKLNDSLTENDSIDFLGMSMSKLVYHLIVWFLIFVLAGLGLVSYMMYFRSNRLTVKHRNELDEIQAEYAKHRTTSREKQAKLKRELQTAINKLETKGKAIG